MSLGNEFLSTTSSSLSQEEIHALTRSCEGEKNLMLSVFDIGRNEFLYHNDTFLNILGYSKQEMTQGGWDFWFQKIRLEDLSEIRSSIETIIRKPDCFVSRTTFTYHIRDTHRKWFLIHHQISLLINSGNNLLISYLYDLSNKECIEKTFSSFCFSVPERPCEISNREKEVLQLIGQGYSSKEIAERLFISIHTAISHRKHLIDKFAVKNTAQLIKEATKSDLI